MTAVSLCSCWSYLFKSDKPALSNDLSERRYTSPRSSTKHQRPTTRSGTSSKRRRRKNDYIRFFKEPKLTFNDLKFSHRLSTIANDKLINFIQLPLTLPSSPDSDRSEKTLVVKTPDQFFHWMGFQRIKLLGKGGFGAVFLVEKSRRVDERKRDEGAVASERMACKEMRLKEKDRGLINSLRAELYVLQSLTNNCRYVVNYYEHYVVQHMSVVDQCSTWLACIFIEFADAGSLLDEVEKKGPLPVSVARRYFHQMVQGLAFMHRNQVSHNDFKLDNVLLMWDDDRRTKYCKLTDFGLARFAYKDGVGVLYSQRYCGTRRYMAPEVIRCGLHTTNNFQYIPFSADIWSLGVSLFVMLRREFPYDTPNDCAKLLQVMQRGVLHTTQLRRDFGRNLTQLLEAMLEFDPDQRYSISRVADHRWVRSQ